MIVTIAPATWTSGLSADQQLLRQSVREFAEAEIRPHVREWDEAQHFPIELVPRLGELGLLGIQLPDQYGGAAMSAVDYCICIEELARVDPGVALSVAAHNGLCSAHILLFGTDAQKRRISRRSRAARRSAPGASPNPRRAAMPPACVPRPSGPVRAGS